MHCTPTPAPRRALRAALGAAALALGAAGCATPGPPTPQEAITSELEGAPDWVRRGCATWWGDEEEARICGVGSMGGTRNISLARTTAIARGRTEIARTLQTKVKAMLKDYQASTTGGEEFGTAADDEQHVVDVSKQITDMSLSGTHLQDTWISENGTVFALVVLDVDRFQDTVQRMETLSETVRRAVIERAEESFRELDEEIERERADRL